MMLVAAIVCSAVLPQRFRWWWLMMGGGLLVAMIGASFGLVPWFGDLHLTGYTVMLLLAFVFAYFVNNKSYILQERCVPFQRDSLRLRIQKK